MVLRKKAGSVYYENFMRQSYFLVPMLLGSAVLIGLTAYRLIKGDKRENKYIPLVEIICSALASFVPLMYFIPLLLFTARSAFSSPGYLPIVLFALCGIILSPFVLTAIRISSKGKLDAESDRDISVLTIFSTILSTFYLLVASVGQFWRK
jgi:hypothetical protein